MKENNINQVTMDIEETVVEKLVERKGIIARAKGKAKEFGEKHPKIVKIGKGVGIGCLALGAYALGKAASGGMTSEETDEVDAESLPVVELDFDEITEE